MCSSDLEVSRRLTTGAAKADDLAAATAAVDDTGGLYRRLPLCGLPELGELAPYYDEWLEHPSYDAYWRATAPRESYERITVPALNFGGWFDVFLKGTLANYTGMKAAGGSEAARSRQRLVIGPWAHGPMAGAFPERSYGLAAGAEAADVTGLQLRWFDWLLKGEETGLAADKPVRLFVMGADEWRDADDWPLPDTDYVEFFLNSGGRANTADGDGTLSTRPPDEQAQDELVYDPRDPVPTTGGSTYLPGLFIGANSGPRDQRKVEARADVLCYTTAPLTEPLTVIGPVRAVLSISSSAPDTDFTAKLVDVAPDGRAYNLADGIQRARYRDSLSRPTFLERGRVYELSIDLVATANVFRPGHRIRLEISSSNFPRFDRNTNTGGIIAREGENDLRRAVNRVHHGPARPSRLVLPVIRGEAAAGRRPIGLRPLGSGARPVRRP